MSNQVYVTAIEYHPEIRKGHDIRGACFYQKTTLTLETGESVPWHISTQRKRDLPARIESQKKGLEKKALSFDTNTKMLITAGLF